MRVLIDRNIDQAVPQRQLEILVMRALRRAGVPELVRQHPVSDDRGCFARLDFADPPLRVGLETDGRSVHARRKAFERDAARRNRLALAGWLVLHVGWETIVRDPDEVARLVQAARATRRRDPQASAGTSPPGAGTNAGGS
jgi:very-short-patch-repair endonuclease